MLNLSEINQWKENGYCLIKNLIDINLMNNCIKFVNNRFYDEKTASKDFGSNGEFDFPSGKIIDYLTINENIIKCIKQLLSNENILLIQSDAWGKAGSINKGKYNNQDQRMHMDYGNNTFLHTSEWNNPEAVGMIIYFSDTNITGGQTAIVPKKNNEDLYKPPYIRMPGYNKYLFYNDKNTTEEYFKKTDINIYNFRNKLYENEILVNAELGDILFYRLDVWHRGTPVKFGKVRNVMNLLWKKRDCFWINNWNQGWTRKMYYGFIEKFFIELNPEQRSVLGVPEPGHKYWNKKNIQFLNDRYPGIDLEPYLSKL